MSRRFERVYIYSGFSTISSFSVDGKVLNRRKYLLDKMGRARIDVDVVESLIRSCEYFANVVMAGKNNWQPLSNRSGEPFTPRSSYTEHKRAEGKAIDQIFSQDPHCRNSQISIFAYIIIGKH